MIRLHNGRLLLICGNANQNWQIRVVLGPKPEHQIEVDAGTVYLQTALERAESLFRAAVARLRPVGTSSMCWDCVQWEMDRQRCGMFFPESRRSGGKFAARCSMFQTAVRS